MIFCSPQAHSKTIQGSGLAEKIMRATYTSGFALILATLLSSSRTLEAAVIFSLTDATYTNVNLVPGMTFSMEFSLQSTDSAPADQVDGVDYVLESYNNSQQPVDNIFTLVSRNSTNSVFSNPLSADSSYSNEVLYPSNGNSLGAAISDSAASQGQWVYNTTVDVADFSMKVNSTAALGTYTINTWYAGDSTAGTYIDGPTFSDNAPTNAYALTINVVSVLPEPSLAAFLGIGTVAAMLRRRRRLA